MIRTISIVLLAIFFSSTSHAFIELNARAMYAFGKGDAYTDSGLTDNERGGLGFGASAFLGMGVFKFGADISQLPVLEGKNSIGNKVEVSSMTYMPIIKVSLPYVYGVAGVGYTRIKIDGSYGGLDKSKATTMIGVGSQAFGNALYGLDLGIRWYSFYSSGSSEKYTQVVPYLGVYIGF